MKEHSRAIDIKDHAKDCLEVVKKQFGVTDKAIRSSLMAQLTNIKYDGVKCIKERFLKLTDIVAKLKEVNMIVSSGYLLTLQL